MNSVSRTKLAVKFVSRTRQNFLAAGVSALMLAFAHIHPELWFISFFALIPFLSRLCHVNKREAVSLGIILATAYICITCLSELFYAPQTFLFKFIALNISFAAFGLIINRVKQNLRCSPLFITAVWFPFGYLLIQYTAVGDILLFTSAGPSLVSGFSSLLGVLLWSCVIICGNSLILLFARFVGRTLFRRRKYRSSSNNLLLPQIEPLVIASHRKCPPNLRAPPGLIFSIS